MYWPEQGSNASMAPAEPSFGLVWDVHGCARQFGSSS